MSKKTKITVAGEVPKELLDALARIPEEFRPEIVPVTIAPPVVPAAEAPAAPEKAKITVAGEIPAELIEALSHVPDEYRPEITSMTGIVISPKAIIKPPIVEVAAAAVVPSLPWYVAWLQPVLDYGGMLTESVANFFAPIFSPIQDGVNALTEWFKNPLKGVIDNLTGSVKAVIDEGISSTVGAVGEIGKGSPEWEKELKANLEPMTSGIIAGYKTALDVKTYEKSPLTGADAVLALDDMKNKLIAAALLNFTLHAAAEAATLGQWEAISQIEPMVVSKFGLNEVIQKATMLPVEKAIIIPAEQELNSRYQQEIPSSNDLIDMALKQIIKDDEYKATMRKLGFSDMWSFNLLHSSYNLPSYTQVLNAYFRGVVKPDELETYRTRLALDPKYKTIWDSLTEVIPSYDELTNELVKEVIDLPTYQKYLQWLGYNKDWAKRIWDAHFFAPSLGDVLTAWRRGIIDEATVDRLMIIIDLDPRFKNVFDTRKYADPSLMLTRMMFETGAIGADEVPDLIHRQGYSPAHEKAVTDYVIRFQERLWRRRYLVALSTAVTLGSESADTLKKEVIAAGYTEGVAEWMLKAADMRSKISSYRVEHPKPKLLGTKDLEKAYILDKINSDVLRTELLQRGYMMDEVDLKIDLMDEDKIIAEEGRRVVGLSIQQWLNAYRYGEINRDTLLIKLQTRGLALDEAETLVKTKEKQWKVVSE